jgi:hypothetical protein
MNTQPHTLLESALDGEITDHRGEPVVPPMSAWTSSGQADIPCRSKWAAANSPPTTDGTPGTLASGQDRDQAFHSVA